MKSGKSTEIEFFSLSTIEIYSNKGLTIIANFKTIKTYLLNHNFDSSWAMHKYQDLLRSRICVQNFSQCFQRVLLDK